MHTPFPTRRRPARRSRCVLAWIAAVVTAALGCSFLLIGGANAAVDERTSWDTNNPGGYSAMINSIRARVMSGPLYDNVAAETTTRDYFLVTLVNGHGLVGADTIRLMFESDNMYLIGFDTGAGHTFYYFSDLTPSEFPAGTTAQGQVRLDVMGGYGSLGVTREGMQMRVSDFEDSIATLVNHRGATTNAAERTALVRFIQGISEAARLGEIHQNISNELTANGYRMAASDTLLENNWSTLSTALRRSLNTGTPPNLTIGGRLFNTLASIANVLALCLMTASLA